MSSDLTTPRARPAAASRPAASPRWQPVKFQADAALLRELGELLVGQAHIALAELVKNAYDADATRCHSLRGHPASHADVNLDAAMLDVPGLWTDPPWQGFRPWH